MQERTAGTAAQAGGVTQEASPRRWGRARLRPLAPPRLAAGGAPARAARPPPRGAARTSLACPRSPCRPPAPPPRQWPRVLAGAEQPPLSPLPILAVSEPLRHVLDVPLADRMRLSAQLVSALAAVLLVLPVYS